MSHHSARGPIPIRTTTVPHRQTTSNLPLLPLINKLRTLTSDSLALCDTIRSHRHLSSTGTATNTLADLEKSLADYLSGLSSVYASHREPHGATFDAGDFPSLTALDLVANTLSKNVKTRLADIAHSRAGSKTKSGFNDIRKTFVKAMADAEEALAALSARLAAASVPPPAPRPKAAEEEKEKRASRTREREEPRVLKDGEIAITYAQFEEMYTIRQMCWKEEVAEGGRRFRNVADPSRVVYGVLPPGGFVQALSR